MILTMHLLRAITVLFVCAGLALAQSGAVLTGTGRVLINDLESRSVALAADDTIQTGDDALVSITEPGSSIVLGSKTAATFGVHRLALSSGHASITTHRSYALLAGPLLIEPQAPIAHYDVARYACRISIVAYDAPLKLSDGSLIAPGQSVTRQEPNCVAPQPNSAAKNIPVKSDKKSPLISSPASNAAAAAGGAAFGAYLSSSDPKASPSRPR